MFLRKYKLILFIETKLLVLVYLQNIKLILTLQNDAHIIDIKNNRKADSMSAFYFFNRLRIKYKGHRSNMIEIIITIMARIIYQIIIKTSLVFSHILIESKEIN